MSQGSDDDGLSDRPGPAPAESFRAGFAQLGERDFRRLFLARFISAFGSAMAPVAMAFGVLELTGSPRDVGWVLAAQTLAQLGFQLFGGALADRRSRQRVMVGGELLAATAQAAIAVLLLRGDAPIPALIGLMAVNGIAFALLWPASVGLVPLVVEAHKLEAANALLSLSQSAAFGLGGATAGVLAATAGSGVAIAVDAATFLVSAGLVASLRPRRQPAIVVTGMLRALREGWTEFTSHRWLWAIVAQFSLVVAAWNGGFMVVGPVVAERALGGAATWAWVAGAFGAGLLSGGLLAIRVRLPRPLLLGSVGVLGLSLPLLALVAPAPTPIIVLAAFAAGLGSQIFSVAWNTALHTEVAPDKLARVSAYDVVGSIALAPLGEAMAGPLIEAIGSGPTLLWGAAFIIAPTLAVLFVPEVRSLAPSDGGGEISFRRHRGGPMKNLFSYAGKRCLFAGCFSGMGEAAAQIVESLGGTVVAADLKKPTSFGFEAFHEVDLRDGSAIEELVARVAADGPIDRLFYCAGLPGTFPTADVLLVNFVGLKHTIESAVPHMPRDGAVVSISSSAGMAYQAQMEAVLPLVTADSWDAGRKWVEEHADGVEGYSFSKMCTIVYTLRRAATLTPETGVRLNCTSPGPTDTPMMPAFVEQAGQKFMDSYPKPVGRNSTSEEQGWPLVFLNSDAASYVSGENLYTDGGGAAAMLTGQLAMDFTLLGQ